MNYQIEIKIQQSSFGRKMFTSSITINHGNKHENPFENITNLQKRENQCKQSLNFH